MRATRFNSLSQLAAVMAGFVVTILLLESEALMTWADRLDVGPARAAAVRVTSTLHSSLRPIGADKIRDASLDGLDRLGWTDDPARLQAAQQRYLLGGASSVARCSVPSPAANPAVWKPIPTNTANTTIPAGVPRDTALAPLPPSIPGRPRVVALVGDSMMAVGLSDVLLRETAGDQNLHVIKAFKSGTGLARPDVFDWTEEYPAMIGNQIPDAIIVAIGANDGQGFVENGKPLAFGTNPWIKAYQQRTADFLALLTQNGAHVVWVGLPPMKSGSYNERAAEINRIAYSVVSQNPLATWWNPQPYIGDPAGEFRELLTAPDGKTTRIRAADGIHLSDEGAALLAPALIHWINPVPQTTTAQVTRPDSTAAVGHHRPRKASARISRP